MAGDDRGERRGPEREPITLRPATVDDAPAIARITVEGWQAAYRGIFPDLFLDALSVEARTRGWRNLLETDDGEYRATLVAERGRQVAGFVSSGPPRDDDLPRDVVEVYAIYVSPDAWRQGIGARLLRGVADLWAERRAPALVLWVLEANDRGRRFYEAMGWRPDGGRQLFEFADVSALEVRYRLDLGSKA